MTRPDRRVRWAAALLLIGGLSGCAAPLPEPGRPAPIIPGEVTLYDNVPTVQRAEQFAGGCRQFVRPVLEHLGVEFTVNQGSGCALPTEGREPFDLLFVDYSMPADRPAPNYFRQVWNSGDTGFGFTKYFRRFVLDERYYAVETDLDGSNPRCDLVVDVGTTRALLFSGRVFTDHVEAVEQKYGKLNSHEMMNWDNRAGLDRWMRDACPSVERDAVTILAAIDPGGGTLAIP